MPTIRCSTGTIVSPRSLRRQQRTCLGSSLGINEWDASPGNHQHDGRASRYLFDPAIDIIEGDLSVLAGQRNAIKGILTALKKVGITDQTTN